MKTIRTKGIARQILITFLIALGLFIRLPGGGRPGWGNAARNLLTSFEGFSLSMVLIILGVFFLVHWVETRSLRDSWKRPTVLVPAAFFALCIIFGSSFEHIGSWNQVFSFADGQLLKSLYVFCAYTALFTYGIRLVFKLLDRSAEHPAGTLETAEPGKGLVGLFRRCLAAHPFWTAFLLLLIAYLPHIIISWPSIFMGDTWQQIVQAYPQLGMTGSPYLTPDIIIRPGVYINQHHPVVHTLLIHLFLLLGDGLFHSFNIGIFLYDLFQFLFLLSAFARVLSLLTKNRQASLGFFVFYLLYIILNPLIHNYLFLITKDTCYAGCLLFLLSGLFRFLQGERGRSVFCEVLLSSVGMLVFRNEARFILFLAFLVMALLYPPIRKQALGLAAGVLAFSVLVFYLLFPALGFTPSSRREAFSVPIQQVARCVRDHREEITEEEWQAIDRFLEADNITALYNPTTADPVKATFRETATTEDIVAFIKTWLGMVVRHPDTCLQAFLHHYYTYFYPGNTRMYRYSYGYSDLNINFANQNIAPLGKSFSLPSWSAKLRKNIDMLWDGGLSEFPLFSFLMSAPVYFWGMILLVCWVIRRRSRTAATLLVCPVLLLLFLLVGPTSGDYGRYLLPVSCSLPILAAMSLRLVRQSSSTDLPH